MVQDRRVDECIDSAFDIADHEHCSESFDEYPGEVAIKRICSPKTELMTSSIKTNEPSSSHVSLMELSQRIRCSQTVVLYSQKIRQVKSSGRF